MTPLLPILLLSQALLITWFHSGFPAHLFGAFKRLGLFRGLWSDTGFETKYRQDWADWAAAVLPAFWAELLTCPVCLSWHVGFWSSVAVVLTEGAPVRYVVLGTCGTVLAFFILHTRTKGNR